MTGRTERTEEQALVAGVWRGHEGTGAYGREIGELEINEDKWESFGFALGWAAGSASRGRRVVVLVGPQRYGGLARWIEIKDAIGSKFVSGDMRELPKRPNGDAWADLENGGMLICPVKEEQLMQWYLARTRATVEQLMEGLQAWYADAIAEEAPAAVCYQLARCSLRTSTRRAGRIW